MQSPENRLCIEHLLKSTYYDCYSHSVLKGLSSIQNGIKYLILWRCVSIVSVKNKRKNFFVYLLCTSKSGISHNSLVARKKFFLHFVDRPYHHTLLHSLAAGAFCVARHIGRTVVLVYFRVFQMAEKPTHYRKG